MKVKNINTYCFDDIKTKDFFKNNAPLLVLMVIMILLFFYQMIIYAANEGLLSYSEMF